MASTMIICYIVFFFLMVKTIQKKTKQAERLKQNNPGENNRPENRSTTNTPSMSASATVAAGNKTVAYGKKKTSESSKTDSNTSMTEYLAEKARQDQIEHAEEKRQEARRLAEKSGGLIPAERLFEGDPVPNGKYCVCCSYCAAPNLIPNGSRKSYSCYFCREPLQ